MNCKSLVNHLLQFHLIDIFNENNLTYLMVTLMIHHLLQFQLIDIYLPVTQVHESILKPIGSGRYNV